VLGIGDEIGDGGWEMGDEILDGGWGMGDGRCKKSWLIGQDFLFSNFHKMKI
jgi:hypothetical protein